MTAKLVRSMNEDHRKIMFAENIPNIYLTIMKYMDEDNVTLMQGVARMFYEEIAPKVLINWQHTNVPKHL